MHKLIEKYKSAEPAVGKIPRDKALSPENQERITDYMKAQLCSGGAWVVAMASLPLQAYTLSHDQGGRISELSDYVGVGLGMIGFSLWSLSMKRLVQHDLSTKAQTPKTDGIIHGTIRHPAYAGFRLGSIGLLCIDPSLENLVATAGVFLATELCARAEEVQLTVGYGKNYYDYMQRTNRFLP